LSRLLPHRSYGPIPHLPGSKIGPSDVLIDHEQCERLTKQPYAGDEIIVSEIIDGSRMGVAKINKEIIPLLASGHPASESPHLQHKLFGDWVKENKHRFRDLLANGEWCACEWCIQAHTTRYRFYGEPFFLLDIISKGNKLTYERMRKRNSHLDSFRIPYFGWYGYNAVSVSSMLALMGTTGWVGARDQVKGAVWRVERNGVVEALAKYVNPSKETENYLERDLPLWNYWDSWNSSESINHLLIIDDAAPF
jgi:hypothetical protein